MQLRWYSTDKVRRRMRACLDAGLYNIRISGDRSLVVGGTGMDPEDEACHRIVIGGEGYAIVDPGSADDEWAPMQGYAVGDFEQSPEIGWVPTSFAEDDELGHHLTFDEFLKRVATPKYWRTVFARLLDLDRAAHEALGDILRDITPAAVALIGARVGELDVFDKSLDPPDPEAAWEAFTQAVRRRAPYAQFIRVEREPWSVSDLVVEFGHGSGRPGEVLYRVSNWGLSVLGNTYPMGPGHDHEAEIAAAHPDPWERQGVLAAVRDLLEIYEAGWAIQSAYEALAERQDQELGALLQTEVYFGEPGAEERLREHDYLPGHPELDHDQILERMKAIVASEMARRPDGPAGEG